MSVFWYFPLFSYNENIIQLHWIYEKDPKLIPLLYNIHRKHQQNSQFSKFFFYIFLVYKFAIKFNQNQFFCSLKWFYFLFAVLSLKAAIITKENHLQAAIQPNWELKHEWDGTVGCVLCAVHKTCFSLTKNVLLLLHCKLREGIAFIVVLTITLSKQKKYEIL